MSSTVADLYDDDLDAFESDLEDARMQAESDWDEQFVADMKASAGLPGYAAGGNGERK